MLNLLKLPTTFLSFLADSGAAGWSERQLRDVLHLSSADDQMAAVMAMTEPVQTASYQCERPFADVGVGVLARGLPSASAWPTCRLGWPIPRPGREP